MLYWKSFGCWQSTKTSLLRSAGITYGITENKTRKREEQLAEINVPERIAPKTMLWTLQVISSIRFEWLLTVWGSLLTHWNYMRNIQTVEQQHQQHSCCICIAEWIQLLEEIITNSYRFGWIWFFVLKNVPIFAINRAVYLFQIKYILKLFFCHANGFSCSPKI